MLPRKYYTQTFPAHNFLTVGVDQGQGGGQAIEDGGALGALLSHIKSLDEIPKRLRLFEEIRRNRASAMQMFSNAGQDEAAKIKEAARAYVKGPMPGNPSLHLFLSKHLLTG
jgi:2-polyprenyl-6-methoxyphenol hydroxylase-like FAD-dependent oxidoreductase